MDSVCVNPDESLAELIHKKGKLSREMKESMNVQDRALIMSKVMSIDKKISDLERAAKTPGQCIRIM
jgi:hypothetical protein